MAAILDLKTWSWHIPESSPYQPFPRSHAIANIINDTSMVFGFGINYHTVFDGVYLFDLKLNTWLPPTEVNNNDTETALNTNMTLIICLSVFGGLVALSMVLCFGLNVIKKKKASIGITPIKKILWNPR